MATAPTAQFRANGWGAEAVYNKTMLTDEAEEFLADSELVACAQAALPEAKQLRDACLAVEIPVVLDRAACCGKGGCGCAPKLQLLARVEDLPRITRLVHEQWRDLALREGTITDGHPAVAGTDSDEAPCPGCGTAAPLNAGACTDCGLQLE